MASFAEQQQSDCWRMSVLQSAFMMRRLKNAWASTPSVRENTCAGARPGRSIACVIWPHHTVTAAQSSAGPTDCTQTPCRADALRTPARFHARQPCLRACPRAHACLGGCVQRHAPSRRRWRAQPAATHRPCASHQMCSAGFQAIRKAPSANSMGQTASSARRAVRVTRTYIEEMTSA